MLRRLLFFIGKLSLALLLLCIVYQATFLAMAYAAQQLTDPPVCQVAYSFPLPFAECRGLRLGLTVEYAMALPGAVLALPFLLPDLLTNPGSSLHPFVVAPILLHLFGWNHLLISLYRNFKARRRR